MRLARFRHRSGSGAARAGVVVGDELVDLEAAAPALPTEPVAILAAGFDAVTEAARAVAGWPDRLELATVELLAPVPRPRKFLAIGINYADHIAETGAVAPEFPVFFNKQVTCVVGPRDPIHVPRVSAQVDYEGELGIVIGRRARHVDRAHAFVVIAGFLVVNDVTVRDWQFKAPTWTLGKSFDTHGPTGPWIVTPDEVADPQDLRLRTLVNGSVVQDASTKEMIVDCAEQVATLSTAFTLEPGDLISTGTPAGVGFTREPPLFLRAGDTVRVEIDSIGAIENPVIDEPAGAASTGAPDS
jgi:2-keto-4-pentenoate hydratase/2-oxohepta-3-ene-1,7-dioic acid hydratase in catechol pathway